MFETCLSNPKANSVDVIKMSNTIIVPTQQEELHLNEKIRERTMMNPDTCARILLVSSLLLCVSAMYNPIISMDFREASRSTAPFRPWSPDLVKIDALQRQTAEETNNSSDINTSVVHSSSSSIRHRTGGDEPRKIIIMGGPSSGKGTQSERIVKQYNVVHLSTGDILRRAVQNDPFSGIGAIAKTFMERGELVPDQVITEVVLDRIQQPDCLERGWILDGFPRTRGQAEAMKKVGISPDLFLFLDVPDSELIERVIGRRSDPVTGKTYHLRFMPPTSQDVRDRLVQRSDDTLDKMENRLKQFHRNADFVSHYYSDVLVRVNGMRDPDHIAGDLFRAINDQLQDSSSQLQQQKVDKTKFQSSIS